MGNIVVEHQIEHHHWADRQDYLVRTYHKSSALFRIGQIRKESPCHTVAAAVLLDSQFVVIAHVSQTLEKGRVAEIEVLRSAAMDRLLRVCRNVTLRCQTNGEFSVWMRLLD